MGENNKGKLRAIPPQFSTQSAQLTITAYTDRPPGLQCSGDIVTALRLLATGMMLVANSVEQIAPQPKKAEADPVDKKREYLGPRKD